MAEFTVGQRWLSETEIDLGLGLVTDVSGRQLSIHFPAVDETRFYATHSAPLARFQLQPEQRAQHFEGWWFTVLNVQQQGGLMVYLVRPDDGDDEHVVMESQIHHQVALNRVLSQVLAAKADRLDLFQLRRQAHNAKVAWQQSGVAGLLGARVQLLAHQIYVAKTVADRFAPRVMLADEVGLGKTIEAGLIIKRRIATGRSQRVLIAVPDSLLHQWIVEMQRRFAITLSLFDEERCLVEAEQGENPFLAAQHILVSQNLLTEPRWADAIAEAEFNLLVLDEAHHIHPQQPQFAAVHSLSTRIPGLLLLTATPDQEGPEAQFSRLQMLDAERFHDFAQFNQQQAQYQQLAPLAQQLASEQPLSTEQWQQLNDYLDLADGSDNHPQHYRKWLNDLLDRHATGRVIFRNRRQSVGGFPKRRVEAIPLAEAEALEPWWEGDPKYAWLIDFLRNNRGEKALLICQSTEQVMALYEALRVSAGIHAAVFHEQMSLIERDRAAAFFASDEEGASILLCSEIGSEGRNFQFVHHLVLYDLPSNPDLLEQRIGRLDRIGQQHDITIYVPYREDEDEAILYPWYQQGMNAFEQCNPVGFSVREAVAEQLQRALNGGSKALEQLLQQTQQQHQQLTQQHEAGRNRLQELSACRQPQADEWVDAVQTFNQENDLADFLNRFWDRFGIHYEALDNNSWLLTPTEHMRIPALPGLSDEGSRVTFDRETALAREDVDWLSWDHPMTQAALETLCDGQFGRVCVAQLNNKALPAGTWFLEADYEVRAQAPKRYALQEFFAGASYRLLVDSQGRDLSQKVSSKALEQQGTYSDKQFSRELLKQLRQPLQTLLLTTEQQAEEMAQAQLHSLQQQLQQQFAEQLQRMDYLAAVNPAVRDDEKAAISERQNALSEALSEASVNLAAVRIWVNVPR